MQTSILTKSQFFYSSLFFSLLLISSCCILTSTPPDLRISEQNFPTTVNTNQSFDLYFKVANSASGISMEDCDLDNSSAGIVNLKMVNRETGHLQVNNDKTLNPIEYNSSQSFTFTVIIGQEGAGTYDMTFVLDPKNTTGSVNTNNKTVTGVIVVN